jgi:pSer/pThr/pTyr-binding forkhead associated (FHA) protein
MSNTTKIVVSQEDNAIVAADVEAIASGNIRPWRIALYLRRMQVKLIVDLVGACAIGRFDAGAGVLPDVDLSPFEAEELGVSRQHLFLKLEGDSVVVVDNDSSNGSYLNGKRLKPAESYPLRHGDKLILGALEVQVELLMNPLN